MREVGEEIARLIKNIGFFALNQRKELLTVCFDSKRRSFKWIHGREKNAEEANESQIYRSRRGKRRKIIDFPGKAGSLSFRGLLLLIDEAKGKEILFTSTSLPFC
jgi:hypothetical protein